MEALNTIINLAVTAGISIITYFLKRTMDKIDKCASKLELAELKNQIDSSVSMEDVHRLQLEIKENEAELKSLSERYATKEELKAINDRMDKLESGIDFLKENSVRKGDFIREFANLSSKIDDLSAYLRGK